MLGLLVMGLPMAYQRAIDNGPDLAGFCDAGRYILEHGTRDPLSTLARYWPSADVPWMVFALLPISVTAVLWYLIGCATWFGLLQTICNRMLVGPDPVCSTAGPAAEQAARRHATLAAGLLALPLVIDGMCMGSFHVLMVWLMIVGLDRACRGEETAGGILLGTAAWLKLLPLLGIGFLVLPAEVEGGPDRHGHRVRAGRRAERRGLWSRRRLAGTRALVARRRGRHRQPAIDVGQWLG